MMGRLMRGLRHLDVGLASLALVGMAVIPLIEILSRPLMGKGIDNAPVVVQHLGLLMAMAGAIAAERFGHLTSLGVLFPRFYGVGQWALRRFVASWLRPVRNWWSAKCPLNKSWLMAYRCGGLN